MSHWLTASCTCPAEKHWGPSPSPASVLGCSAHINSWLTGTGLVRLPAPWNCFRSSHIRDQRSTADLKREVCILITSNNKQWCFGKWVFLDLLFITIHRCILYFPTYHRLLCEAATGTRRQRFSSLALWGPAVKPPGSLAVAGGWWGRTHPPWELWAAGGSGKTDCRSAGPLCQSLGGEHREREKITL